MAVDEAGHLVSPGSSFLAKESRRRPEVISKARRSSPGLRLKVDDALAVGGCSARVMAVVKRNLYEALGRLVSERLGHSSVAFTLETYSHVMPGMQPEAAKLFMDLVLGSADEQNDGEEAAP